MQRARLIRQYCNPALVRTNRARHNPRRKRNPPRNPKRIRIDLKQRPPLRTTDENLLADPEHLPRNLAQRDRRHAPEFR